MITKYVKFDFFRVTFRPIGAPASVPDTNFDLRPLIHRLSNMDLLPRTIPYKQERARMESHGFDKYWDLYFARLRDFNLPSRAKEDGPSEPFDLDDDEYIGENVSAIYDEDYHVLMLQRNRNSLGPAAIEEYINYFNEDPEMEINLRPIKYQDPNAKVSNAAYHRKIRIKFADINTANPEGRGQSMRKWLTIFKEYESVTGEITISVGRKKEATLGGNLRSFIDELQDNKDIVTGAEMTIKKSELSETEVVDLFEDHAHVILPFTVLPRTVLNHEAVIYQMAQAYAKKKAEIVGNLR